MLCDRCGERNALEREGAPVRLNLFETYEGYFCEECVLALQEPFNTALRERISARAPGLTEDDLARVPDQMLKFTVNLPLPRKPGA